MTLLSMVKGGHDELEDDDGFKTATRSDDRCVEQIAESWNETPVDRVGGKRRLIKDTHGSWAMHKDGEENKRELRSFFEMLVGTYCAQFGGDIGVFFATLASQSREERRQEERYYLVRATPCEVSEQYLPLDDVFNALDRRTAEA